MNTRPVDSTENRAPLEGWAQQVIRVHVDRAGEALMEHCKKPRSAKRLHSARKQLARLRAALDDLSALAGVTPGFRERVHELHKRAGKVRDADVLKDRVRSYCDEAFGSGRGQLHAIDAALCKRRKKGRRKLRRIVAETMPELRS